MKRAIVMLVVACGHRAFAPVTTTAATWIPNDAAIGDIAEARCTRVDACNRLGPAERWGNARDCLNDAIADGAIEIGVDSCPGGVDDEGVRRCLNDIRARPCDARLYIQRNEPTCARWSLCK